MLKKDDARSSAFGAPQGANFCDQRRSARILVRNPSNPLPVGEDSAGEEAEDAQMCRPRRAKIFEELSKIMRNLTCNCNFAWALVHRSISGSGAGADDDDHTVAN